MDNVLDTKNISKNLSKELSIELLKKIVSIRCPQEQEEGLLLAAEQLEKRLQSLRRKDQIWNRDDILAITALNLMDEVICLKQKLVELNNSQVNTQKNCWGSDDLDQIKSIIKKIDVHCCNEK